MCSRKLFSLLALVLIGCGDSSTAKNPDPVEITGKITASGKPVSNVFLNLQPTAGGGQAFAPVINGEVKITAMPGTYTYFVSEGKPADAFKLIPEKYHAGAMDRQIEIAQGTTLDLKLD
jgi:hypothetical protein